MLCFHTKPVLNRQLLERIQISAVLFAHGKLGCDDKGCDRKTQHTTPVVFLGKKVYKINFGTVENRSHDVASRLATVTQLNVLIKHVPVVYCPYY